MGTGLGRQNPAGLCPLPSLTLEVEAGLAAEAEGAVARAASVARCGGWPASLQASGHRARVWEASASGNAAASAAASGTQQVVFFMPLEFPNPIPGCAQLLWAVRMHVSILCRIL
jgi:hypothetical protein